MRGDKWEKWQGPFRTKDQLIKHPDLHDRYLWCSDKHIVWYSYKSVQKSFGSLYQYNVPLPSECVAAVVKNNELQPGTREFPQGPGDDEEDQLAKGASNDEPPREQQRIENGDNQI